MQAAAARQGLILLRPAARQRTVRYPVREAEMEQSLREARLKGQYTTLYPGIKANVWLPAREVAEHIIAVVRHQGANRGAGGRMLAEEHFEFRGGESPGRQSRDERREDRERAAS